MEAFDDPIDDPTICSACSAAISDGSGTYREDLSGEIWGILCPSCTRNFVWLDSFNSKWAVEEGDEEGEDSPEPDQTDGGCN